ncbi:ZFP36L1 [Symbiodinium natans]|uniref:ZFP36L1 protein n=1 Tax=Symbiodinium natans TaxID=878477 RepID=A0A812V052_9DINO|nr:ZFP36L1 [Symbiodinium natans]
MKLVLLVKQGLVAPGGGKGPRFKPMQPKSIFHGTVLCKFFEKGKCSRGSACNFAHGRGQLREKPNLAKTKWCSVFMETWSCSAGEACPYAHHGVEEKRKHRGRLERGVSDGSDAGDIAEDASLASSSSLPAQAAPADAGTASTASAASAACCAPSESCADAAAAQKRDPDAGEDSRHADAMNEESDESGTAQESDGSDVSLDLVMAVRNTFLHFGQQPEKSGSGLRRPASWSC